MTAIEELQELFRQHRKPEQVEAMENYMKNNFQFLGLKTDSRRGLFTEWYKKHEPEIKADFRSIAQQLFEMPYREFHYCGMEVLIKAIKKNYRIEDIDLIEFFLINQST